MIRYTSQNQQSLPGFETPFEQSLDPNNRWVKLGRVVPWDELAEIYGRRMSDGQGRPGKNPRLVIGAMIIKHKQRLSDEETVLQIQENMYLQWFCGYSSFSSEQPFAPSLFVEIRRRMGAEVFGQFEAALQARLESIKDSKRRRDSDDGHDDDDPPAVSRDEATAPAAEGAEEPEPQGKLILDATVAEQAIRYPTDLGLLNEAREVSERLIDRLYPLSGLQKKPRTYRKKARQAFLAVIKKRKPRQNVRHRAIKQQLQYLRRNLGHIDALLDRYWAWDAETMEGLPPFSGMTMPLCYRHLRQLWVIRAVYDQQQAMYAKRSWRCDDRIVSISQPHVRPIVRGKAGKSVEFGAKISASLNDDGLARADEIRWDAFNESGDLPAQIEAYKVRYGHYPEVVLADGIYGTRDNRRYCKERGIRFGGKPLGRPKKATESNREEILEKKRQRRRDEVERIPIEGKFGQGKNGYGLGRIRAKRSDTSEAWIRAIFFVMNLMLLIRFLFVSKMPGMRRFIAALTTRLGIHVRWLAIPGWCSGGSHGRVQEVAWAF